MQLLTRELHRVGIVVERVATGIKGFDQLVEGGFPKRSSILITGPPGSGKSIFSMQYLYNGAMNGENGVYVYMDSALDILKIQAKQFGMDFEKLEQEGKVIFIHVPLTKRKFDLFYNIEDAVKKIGAKRLVFDSLPTFVINMDLFTVPAAYAGAAASNVTTTRDLIATNSSALAASPKQDSDKIVYQGDQEKRIISITIDQLRKLETTNLIATFGNEELNKITNDGISEYACDGVIAMNIQHIAKKTVRSITIKKMRNTKQELDDFLLNISEKGLSVEKESVFEGSKISGINE
jgi:KaiC/GvpD/RAD55 family RecA-like ATPase